MPKLELELGPIDLRAFHFYYLEVFLTRLMAEAEERLLYASTTKQLFPSVQKSSSSLNVKNQWRSRKIVLGGANPHFC